MLWKKNKVDTIEGEGSLTAEGNVAVGDATYEAGAVILATGSVALAIPGVEFSDRVVDTWGAWSLPSQPKSLAVVGAGASGAEIASAYGRFETEVTLIEMLDQILPAEDKDMARVVERTFKKQDITVSTGTPVESVDAGKKSVKVKYGETEIEVDYLCIAGGRAPDTEALNLDAAGVKTTDGGKIEVDDYQRTSNPKVYAIGDLVGRKALAHKASEEGVVAVEHAAGVETHPVDENLVAGATFCQPQVASVGLTEAQAKEAGHDVKIGKQKLGRSRRRADLRRSRRTGEAGGRLRVRRDPRRPHRRQPCLRHAPRARQHHGARGGLPGAGEDRPPAPDDVGGHPGCRARRGRLGDPRLAS